MAITVVGSAVPSGNPTTSFTVSIPSGTATNDVLVLACTNRDSTAAPTVTDNDTGGNTWTQFGGGTTGVSLWWKRATSGTASKTITASGFTGSSSGVLRVFRGCSLGTPYENVSTAESNASGDETNAGITPTRNGCWVCLVVSNRTNDLATTTHAATSPASLSTFTEKLSTGGSDCSTGFASGEQTTAGATGNITWAQTNAASLSIVFDMVPAYVALVADVRTYTLAANDTGLLEAKRLTSDVRTYALTASDTGLVRGRNMAADAASFAATAFDSGLTEAKLLTADVASFALAPTTTGLASTKRVTADQATFALSPTTTELTEAKLIAAEQATFTVTPTTTGTTKQWRLDATASSFAVTGQDATLTYDAADAVLAADVSSFAVTPTATPLVAARLLPATQSAYALSAAAAILIVAHVLTANQASFTMSGQDAQLLHGTGGAYTLTATAAAFDLTERDATLTYSPIFSLTPRVRTGSMAAAAAKYQGPRPFRRRHT